MPDERRFARPHPEVGSIRGTITAMLIAFICVLIFRAAVVEAFIIPTGSMAPTLLGRHVRLHSPLTGATWVVGSSRDAGVEDARVTDPYTMLRVVAEGAPVASGDRIFVFKPASFFRTPPRWSVVVFKNPENPRENYIKRLIGLPGEDIWLVDGDVFVRRGGGDWRIARKPRRVQESLWRTLYSSELAPRFAEGDLRWRSPWLLRAESDGGALPTDGPTFAVGAARHILEWNDAVHPVTDEAAYNDTPSLRGARVFPAGDVRVRFAAKPDARGLGASIVLSARSHDFRLEIDAERVRLGERPFDSADGRWTALADAPFEGFTPGAWTDVAFALVDQTLIATIDGRTVARHELDWSPRERLEYATGLEDADLDAMLDDERTSDLAQPGLYRRSQAHVRVEFAGAPATLSRVGLDRDVSYDPTERLTGPFAGEMGLATHPLRAAHLAADQLFVLGDNSGASRDGRLWDSVDPLVAAQIGRDVGVVPLDLLVGRAFMVYFPAPHEVRVAGARRSLVPDVGRVRLIR